MKTNTQKIELVETHNIATSLNRMAGAPYDTFRWRRALYHAICMSNVSINEDAKKQIREALELP